MGAGQHYVAFGVWGDGFGLENFEFSVFEGGIFGAVLGAPTGLVAIYLHLRKTANCKHAAFILLGSLLCGVGPAVAIFWPPAFVTPFATLGMALIAQKIE
jgi:hypothetical protein